MVGEKKKSHERCTPSESSEATVCLHPTSASFSPQREEGGGGGRQDEEDASRHPCDTLVRKWSRTTMRMRNCVMYTLPYACTLDDSNE